jgi:rhodanese-related sulfurtransferase
MQHITPQLLQQWMAEGHTFMLVDVREPNEHAEFNIGGLLIPLGDIITRAAELPAEIPVVLYCRKGVRSQVAIQRLEDKFGFTRLINLSGGMERWKKEMAQ